MAPHSPDLKIEDKSAANVGTSARKVSPADPVPDNNNVDGDDQLIDRVNELQDKLAVSGQRLDVELPKIAVVGGQSAGKSSVLENLARKEFLPRGTDTVTRRPTIVRLQPLPPGSQEYAVFGHAEDKKFYDFEQVKQEISAETDRDPGPSKDQFSSNPITLTIYSPHVLKLTLVDLPGLIHVVADKRSENSIKEVRDMVLDQIKSEKTIILAITPANQDLMTSDALAVAKLADPNGERTIGVLTKLDIMDKGTDALDILENRKIELKKGYIGVVNRSQDDIAKGKDINYILDYEKKFFREHPRYKHIAHKMGIPHLRTVLRDELKQHIKAYMPTLRNELQKRLSKNRSELKDLMNSLGESNKNEDQSKHYIMNRLNKFITELGVQLGGNSERVGLKEFSAGAKINHRLKSFQNNLKLDMTVSDEELSRLIANLAATRDIIAIPTPAFDILCANLLIQYEIPLDTTIAAVTKIIMEAVEAAANEVNETPNLKNQILFKVRGCVEKETDNLKDRIHEFLDSEKNYVNLSHPDFDYSACESLCTKMEPMAIWSGKSKGEEVNSQNCDTILQSELMGNEALQEKVKYLKTMAIKYIEIIHKKIGDTAIKFTNFFLVRKLQAYINNDLVIYFTQTSDTAPLMEDLEGYFQRRMELENEGQCLDEAVAAMYAF